MFEKIATMKALPAPPTHSALPQPRRNHMRTIKATIMIAVAVTGFAMLSQFACNALVEAVSYNSQHYAKMGGVR
jgi:F0F1-type ATP synthase membrane subunit c/vacuolar-type H+-ATPase subunit K